MTVDDLRRFCVSLKTTVLVGDTLVVHRDGLLARPTRKDERGAPSDPEQDEIDLSRASKFELTWHDGSSVSMQSDALGWAVLVGPPFAAALERQSRHRVPVLFFGDTHLAPSGGVLGEHRVGRIENATVDLGVHPVPIRVSSCVHCEAVFLGR